MPVRPRWSLIASDCHPIPQVAHFHTGLSSFICVVPALYMFAPGSPAMLALIGQLHRAAGEASYSSTSAYAANVATSIKEGIALARQAIESGAAKQKLEQFVAFTQKAGGAA
jgi:hypothetical protein